MFIVKVFEKEFGFYSADKLVLLYDLNSEKL